jgi:hypothetical protein
MALVERLTYREEPFIATHAFYAAMIELLMGRVTSAGIKGYLGMDTAAAAELDALIANAPSGTSATALANRALYVHGIHSIIVLANHREGNSPPGGTLPPGYDTPAAVRSKLGI